MAAQPCRPPPRRPAFRCRPPGFLPSWIKLARPRGRTGWTAHPDGSVDLWRHFFYDVSWRLLETRKSTSAENDQPENLNPEYQYVWSPRYIDAPILRDENKDADGDCHDGSDLRL